jgi:hypothetical protein
MKKVIFLIVLLLVVIAGAIIPNYININKTPNKVQPIVDIEQPVNVEQRGEEILTALKNNDTIMLSKYVHPVKGVRFSPYTNVKEGDQVFTPEMVKMGPTFSRTFIWGAYDGSGQSIDLPFGQYFEKFVYDHDYLNAEKKSVNEPIGSGNMINNVSEFYPGATILEYYFSGFDPQYEGMDWASLKLVLEKYNDEWYLIGVVHDGWTI